MEDHRAWTAVWRVLLGTLVPQCGRPEGERCLPSAAS